MGRRIFVLIQPFDYKQNIEVFDDENSIIQTIQLTMTEIPEQLCALSKKYNIT